VINVCFTFAFFSWNQESSPKATPANSYTFKRLPPVCLHGLCVRHQRNKTLSSLCVCRCFLALFLACRLVLDGSWRLHYVFNACERWDGCAFQWIKVSRAEHWPTEAILQRVKKLQAAPASSNTDWQVRLWNQVRWKLNATHFACAVLSRLLIWADTELSQWCEQRMIGL